jgi:hypothetical protein
MIESTPRSARLPIWIIHMRSDASIALEDGGVIETSRAESGMLPSDCVFAR